MSDDENEVDVEIEDGLPDEVDAESEDETEDEEDDELSEDSGPWSDDGNQRSGGGGCSASGANTR